MPSVAAANGGEAGWSSCSGGASRTEIAARTGALAQVAGVELLEFADGPERGVRVLEFRTGAGLSFRVAIERGFDLLSAEYRGIPIGWRSPTGPRHPGLASVEESRGWGFLRSFTGLLATCGLDHALAPATSSAAHYIYPGFSESDYPLHGRISQIPARLLGYGERWEGDACTLCAEGEVAQMAVFGENLVLTRRIEAALGGTAITRDGPGREPRLPADPAHAALPLQLRLPAARRGRRAAAAEPRDRPHDARGPARPGRRLSDPGAAQGRLQRAGLRARPGRRGRTAWRRPR